MAGMLEWLLQQHLGGPAPGMMPPPPIGPEQPPQPLMSGAEPDAAWTGGGVQPVQRGLPKDTANPMAPLMGMLSSLMQRPTTPGFSGESPVAPSDGGWWRDGAGSAAASPSGAEPNEVWSAGAQPPSTNDPLSGEPKLVSDVPLPRPRPSFDGSEGSPDTPMPGAPLSLAPRDYQDQLPRNSTLTDGRTSPKDRPMPGSEVGGKSLFDRIFDPNKAATWMALGSGFAGAGSIGTGIRRASANAVPAMAADRAQITRQSSISDTYKALVAKGVSPAEALAASQNPEIMKAVASKYFETKPRTAHKIGTDMFGSDIMGSFDPNTGKYYTTAGKEVGGSGLGGETGLQSADLAKGVSAVNHDLVGDDYLNQFSPEVKSAVMNYVEGKSMPTGNPRKGFTQTIKMLAQKYGNDTGMQVDDTTFGARRTMRNQLSSGASGSLGGQINIGTTALGHLADLSEKAHALGNWDVGLGPPSEWINTARGLGSAQQAKMDALKGAAQHYGQEITKFYSGSPGGQEERNRFLKTVDGAKTPQALAAVIETEAQLMHERLQSLESQIHGTLGAAGTKQYPVVRPEGKVSLEKLTANVNRMRGIDTAPPAPPVPKLKPNESTTINGVTIKRLN